MRRPSEVLVLAATVLGLDGCELRGHVASAATGEKAAQWAAERVTDPALLVTLAVQAKARTALLHGIHEGVQLLLGLVHRRDPRSVCPIAAGGDGGVLVSRPARSSAATSPRSASPRSKTV